MKVDRVVCFYFSIWRNIASYGDGGGGLISIDGGIKIDYICGWGVCGSGAGDGACTVAVHECVWFCWLCFIRRLCASRSAVALASLASSWYFWAFYMKYHSFLDNISFSLLVVCVYRYKFAKVAWIIVLLSLSLCSSALRSLILSSSASASSLSPLLSAVILWLFMEWQSSFFSCIFGMVVFVAWCCAGWIDKSSADAREVFVFHLLLMRWLFIRLLFSWWLYWLIGHCCAVVGGLLNADVGHDVVVWLFGGRMCCIIDANDVSRVLVVIYRGVKSFECFRDYFPSCWIFWDNFLHIRDESEAKRRGGRTMRKRIEVKVFEAIFVMDLGYGFCD